MSKVIISGVGNQHDLLVAEAFKKGYAANGARFSGDLIVYQYNSPPISDFQNPGIVMQYAKENGYDIVIFSTGGAQSNVPVANTYFPDVMLFMPAGYNDYEQTFTLSITGNNVSTVITGTTINGTEQNITGYNIEFLDIDPLYNYASSYSNGYIAGKIAYIKDYLKCSNWEARYIARQSSTKSNNYTNQNGFGIIDVVKAINTQYNVPENPIYKIGDVGNLTTTRNNSTVNISWDAVENADVLYNSYKLYKNDQVIYSGINTTYTDTILPGQKNFYKYKGFNNTGETDFSDTKKVFYPAYKKIYI